MSRHTLGPWKFYTKPQPNGCPIVGARGLMVAMLAHSINHDDQRETALANARLIAAAPELLAALDALVEDQRDASLPVLAQARAAIKKAHGIGERE